MGELSKVGKKRKKTKIIKLFFYSFDHKGEEKCCEKIKWKIDAMETTLLLLFGVAKEEEDERPDTFEIAS